MKALSHISARRWLLGLALLASAAVALTAPGPQDGARSEAVAALAAGEVCPSIDEGSFRWVWPDLVERSSAMEWHPAVFLGRVGDGLRDVYVADFLVASDGRPREIRRLTNLSKTTDGDEAVLAAAGDGRVAYAARVGGAFLGFDLVDFSGEPEELTADWPQGWRMANQISNFQRTGRLEGVHWRSYVFVEIPHEISLEFDGPDGVLDVRVAGESLTVDTGGGTGSAAVIPQQMVKGRPALLAWAVDTVRAVPWIGRRKIEWLEKYWFDFSDWLARVKYDLMGDETEQEAPLEYAATTPSVAELPGWPPPSIEPALNRRVEGEGIWAPVDDGVFNPDVPGPPLFYQTFVRVDPKRPFARIHITAWDPDRVGLGIMAGVLEPLSTTGIRGRGEVPRESDDGDDVSRLVGAFNGAFQALHGEWGMALERRYFLPPRAYGATVAVYDDGRVAMGTWPHPVVEMPLGMQDLRQNVHPLVERGRFNPYQRVWWGGVPQGLDDRVFTIRSGICLTHGGKVAYFWGEHQSPETLAQAMLNAGCDYGIHLDMNAGHCGFEYYRVDPSGEQPDIGREIHPKYEAEGVVPRRDDLFFRARKMVREMSQMRFPRYIGRDPRDFFYLVLRDSIFDDPPAGAKGGEWKPCGGEEGRPTPVVSAELEGGVRLLKVDPAQVALSVEETRPADALLAVPFGTGGEGIRTGLVIDGSEVHELQPGAYGISFDERAVALLEPGARTPATDLVQGISESMARMFEVRHMLGIDARGYLVVASGQSGEKALAAGLAEAGVERSMAMIPPGISQEAPAYWLVARAEGVPAWLRIFEDTEPVPPPVWREVFRQRGHLLDHDD
jgi:hypothetical protein